MRMKQLYTFATFLVVLSFSNACEESVLLVGGQNESGHISSLQLLTPNGWCQDIDFPNLEEPVVNPGVYAFEESKSMKIILIVCGFGNGHCKWTHDGAVDWYPLEVPPSPWATAPLWDFQILALDEQNLSMISIMSDNDSKGCTHTISQNFPPEITFITEFEQEIHVENIMHKKDITGSCYAKSGDLLILSGGRTPMMEVPDHEYWQTKFSHASVGGNFKNQFWVDNINELNEAREDHACLGMSSGVIVGGGQKYNYLFTINSYQTQIWKNHTYETLASVEILEDNVWTSGPLFKTARQDFGIVEVCEDLLAIGGMDYSGELSEYRVRHGGVNGPVWWDTTITDTTKETFLDSIEILGRFSWTDYKYSLPSPMSSFGVVKVPSSICKSQ